MAKTEKESIYVLIGNIPEKLRSADLRAFFSQFIESQGFICFHYRHRPENKLFSSVHPITTESTENNDNNTERQSSSESQDSKGLDRNANKVKHSETKCCVTIMEKGKFPNFMRCYRRRIWTDKEGNYLNSRIFISAIKINDLNVADPVDINNSNQTWKNRLTTDDFVKLPGTFMLKCNLL